MVGFSFPFKSIVLYNKLRDQILIAFAESVIESVILRAYKFAFRSKTQ